MKKLIKFALVALVCGVCGVNAGEVQDSWCDDKSLSYCIKHFDRQCEAKNYFACVIMGDLHYGQKRYSESKKYYEMVCDKANSKDSYQLELVDGSLGNKVPAIKVMQFSCNVLAKHYYNGWGVRQDFVKALQYFNKACDLGNGNSCAGAGSQYYDGEGTKKDLNRAIKLLTKSCELESAVGCSMLGAMYVITGEGVKQNLSKAKEIFGKACDLGNQDGCDNYKKLNENGVK